MNPESVLPNANIAGMLAEEGKPELADVYYQRAIQNNTWLPSAYQNYGRVLVTLKRYDEAAKQFSRASQIDPFDASPHFFMGRLLLKQGHDVEAVKQLREGIRLEPGNLEMMILTASILASSEDAQARNGTEAVALANRAVQFTESKQAAALDVLAMSYAETGRFDKAVQIELVAIYQAEVNGQKDEVELLQKRLQKYQSHQPWRESFKDK